jgi:hypothetical protein|eukprot:Transcript_27876.p1 GENE.Transcript_27876~~Transcript_27876.p1  ORF type:complete len:304 (-),score=103.90 Transcript_27876:104-1015(-)
MHRAGSLASSTHQFYKDEDAELLVTTEAAKTITTLLSSLLLKNERATDGPVAWCSANEEGLVFSVELANTMRATARLSRGLFTEWRLCDDVGSQGLGFGVNLGILVECLRIFSGTEQQQLQLSYNAEKSVLRLTLVEGAAVTDCEVGTLDTEEIPAVGASLPGACIVLESALLTEALQDFQSATDDKDHPRLRLRTGLQPPQLSLLVTSDDVGCEITYPPTALTSFDVSGELEAEYSFPYVRMALRSLKESDQTCLRLGEDGLLHLRVRIRAELVEDIFVTYLLSPLMSDEIEEDMSANTAGG